VNARRTVPMLFLLACLAASPVLAQYVSLEGEVVREDGTPVAGATVVAQPPAESGAKALRTVKTKKNGSFKMGAVEFGTYRFRAEIDGLLIGHVDLTIIRNNQTERTESFDVGPTQELPEFRVEPGRVVQLKFTMVGKDHFAGVLSIPGDTEASEKLVEASNLFGAGKYQESAALLEEVLASAATDANANYLLGLNLVALGRAPDAEKHFVAALASNPAQKGANAQLGAIAYERGDREGAVDYFTKELDNSPGELVLLINRAKILADLGRNEEAIAGFLAVIEVAPTEGGAYAELVNLYQAIGDDAKAAETLEKMEAVTQPDPGMWFNIGAGYANRELMDKAAEAYRHALKLDPTFAPAVRELGFALLQLGDQAGALEQFRQYLVLEPAAEDAETVQGLVGYLEAAGAGK